jgi:hypothetical protein
VVPGNIYFELTRAFNAGGATVALASGQAVVYYRVAIMSKDGDWVIREDAAACADVLGVLAGRGASYRPGAPLDVRWLSGGWSSHFEFRDPLGRRVRCDFFSRPPRVSPEALAALFREVHDPLHAIDLESLIRMKQSQRDKDYAVIGQLASRLPPAREILLTTDPDRLLLLAPRYGVSAVRAPVTAARTGDRDAVVVALARERDALQQADRARLDAYAAAARPFLDEFARLDQRALALPDAHGTLCRLAEHTLPVQVNLGGAGHAATE